MGPALVRISEFSGYVKPLKKIGLNDFLMIKVNDRVNQLRFLFEGVGVAIISLQQHTHYIQAQEFTLTAYHRAAQGRVRSGDNSWQLQC